MKHQITTTTKGDSWTQAMTCEFANAIIAQLVKETMRLETYDKRETIPSPTGRGVAAVVKHEGATITLTCINRNNWQQCWSADLDTNKQELEKLAQSWQVREGIYLPAMQYFEAGAETFNRKQREWADQHNKDAKILECRIEELERKLDANQNHQESTNEWLTKELQERGGILEALKGLDSQLEALLRLHEGLYSQFSLHKEKLFHFLDRKGK